MRIDDYRNLDDRISVDECETLFVNVMQEYEHGLHEKQDFLEILLELTDRQVMTYEVLINDVREKLDVLVCKLWNTTSYDDVDMILSIVVNLGLTKCYEIIKASLANDKDVKKEIIDEIKETIEENGKKLLR